MNTKEKQFTTLMEYAINENDVVIYNMLMAYTNHPKDWGEFMVEVIMALSAVNKATPDHLKQVISQHNHTIMMSKPWLTNGNVG